MYSLIYCSLLLLQNLCAVNEIYPHYNDSILHTKDTSLYTLLSSHAFDAISIMIAMQIKYAFQLPNDIIIKLLQYIPHTGPFIKKRSFNAINKKKKPLLVHKDFIILQQISHTKNKFPIDKKTKLEIIKLNNALSNLDIQKQLLSIGALIPEAELTEMPKSTILFKKCKPMLATNSSIFNIKNQQKLMLPLDQPLFVFFANHVKNKYNTMWIYNKQDASNYYFLIKGYINKALCHKNLLIIDVLGSYTDKQSNLFLHRLEIYPISEKILQFTQAFKDKPITKIIEPIQIIPLPWMQDSEIPFQTKLNVANDNELILKSVNGTSQEYTLFKRNLFPD